MSELEAVTGVPRYRIERSLGTMRVVIPSHTPGFATAFLAAWVCGWAAGEVSVARTLLHPDARTPLLFLGAWLAGWSVAGTVAISTLLWQLAGAEILTVDGTLLTHRIAIAGWSRTRRYRTADIHRLRTDWRGGNTSRGGLDTPPLSESGEGALAFDYVARTVWIGAPLDEAESIALKRELCAWLPGACHDREACS